MAFDDIIFIGAIVFVAVVFIGFFIHLGTCDL